MLPQGQLGIDSTLNIAMPDAEQSLHILLPNETETYSCTCSILILRSAHGNRLSSASHPAYCSQVLLLPQMRGRLRIRNLKYVKPERPSITLRRQRKVRELTPIILTGYKLNQKINTIKSL